MLLSFAAARFILSGSLKAQLQMAAKIVDWRVQLRRRRKFKKQM